VTYADMMVLDSCMYKMMDMVNSTRMIKNVNNVRPSSEQRVFDIKNSEI
jgi:hypothetical protein